MTIVIQTLNVFSIIMSALSFGFASGSHNMTAALGWMVAICALFQIVIFQFKED